MLTPEKIERIKILLKKSRSFKTIAHYTGATLEEIQEIATGPKREKRPREPTERLASRKVFTMPQRCINGHMTPQSPCLTCQTREFR